MGGQQSRGGQTTQLKETRGGGEIQRSSKRHRISRTSPGSTFLARHSCFSWFEADVWTEVAKYLDGSDLVRLGLTNRWFHRLINEESIWKYAYLRDLHVLPPLRVSFPWKQLYASAFGINLQPSSNAPPPSCILQPNPHLHPSDGSHSYSVRHKEKHIGENASVSTALYALFSLLLIDSLVEPLDRMRIGAFFLDSPVVLLSETLTLPNRLPRPHDDRAKTIQCTGTCLLTDARTGIWIADLQLVRCPVCNLNTCEGTMQVLDARHAELFLEQGYKDGSWDYEDIGSRRIEKSAGAATGAIFDVKHLLGPSTVGVMDAKAWVGQQDDWQPKARLSIHAVAVNTNLQANEGLQVRFQTMTSTGADQKVVSIRISQQLI